MSESILRALPAGNKSTVEVAFEALYGDGADCADVLKLVIVMRSRGIIRTQTLLSISRVVRYESQ